MIRSVEYHDVELHTTDNEIFQWRESEIIRFIPSLINILPTKRGQKRIQLLLDVPFDLYIMKILKEFSQKGYINDQLSFSDYEYMLKSIQQFPKHEIRMLEDHIFSILYKDICNMNCIDNIFRACEDKSIDYHFYSRLTKEQLEDIISDNELSINTEEDVILIILTWIDAVPLERTIYLKRLMKHVRKDGIRKKMKEIVSMLQTIPVSEVIFSSEPSRHFKDKLLVCGGHQYDPETSQYGPTTLMEMYDLINNRWIKLDSQLPYSISYHAALYLNDDLYIFGGSSTKEIASKKGVKLRNGIWYPIADLNQPRSYITNSCCIYNQELYVIGGHNGHRRERTNELFAIANTRLKSVEKYNPVKDEWTFVSEMNFGRSDATCSVLNDRIYVFGGFDGVRILDTIEMYVPSIDHWTILEPRLPSPRSGLSSVVYNDHIVLLGGSDGQTRHSTNFSFYPKSESWTIGDDMISARSNFSACKLGKNIVVVGGFSRNVLRYSEFLHEDHWQEIASIRASKSALAAVVIPHSDEASLFSVKI